MYFSFALSAFFIKCRPTGFRLTHKRKTTTPRTDRFALAGCCAIAVLCLAGASAPAQAIEFFNTAETASAACNAERARLQPSPPNCHQLRCDHFAEVPVEGEVIGPGFDLKDLCAGFT
ncbi:MAG: hypothetical protein ACE5H7_15445, partial [Acidiferrobacterales bacterium]